MTATAMLDAALRAAAAGAAALAVHAAINAILLRRPPHPEGVDLPTSGVRKSTGSGAGVGAPHVSVLVPARDEAARIGPCIRALLASRGVDLELLVYDDGSTDGTADVASRAAAGDARLRVITGTPPPRGWLGKPHACAQLAAAAGGGTLVFVDADVIVAPDGLARTLALLDSSGLELVCPYPRQLAVGLAERLVQPLLQWSWLSFLPLRLAERPALHSMTAANGQLLAVREDAYRRAGGHAGPAVRAAVIEDIALARTVKRTGGRAGVADGTAVATCRMYGGWDELRDGYGKSLWAAFGSTSGAAFAGALLAALYLLPPVAAAAAVTGRRRTATLGAIGYAAGVAGRAVAAARTGGRVGDAAAHPASVAALLYLLASSVHRHRHRRLTWKGRPL